MFTETVDEIFTLPGVWPRREMRSPGTVDQVDRVFEEAGGRKLEGRLVRTRW